MNHNGDQFPISHVNTVKSSAPLSEDFGAKESHWVKPSSGIGDVSNTYVHKGSDNDYAVNVKIPDKDNKIDSNGVAGKGRIVAEGRGKTYQEAYNKASTKRTEGLKSGEFAKPSAAEETQAETRKEQLALGNPNYKPNPVVKIRSNK
jgi:hypothetical protein